MSRALILLSLAASLVSSGPAPTQAAQPQAEALARIDYSYRQQVEPILRLKCFDCHTDRTHYPRYYRLPLVKQMIDRDIRRARRSLDLTKPFPFSSEVAPEKVLGDLHDVVGEGDMPPLLYRLAHWQSALSKPEQAQVLRWVQQAQGELAPQPLRRP